MSEITEIILYISIPSLAVFILVLLIYFIYKLYKLALKSSQNDEDTQLLLGNQAESETTYTAITSSSYNSLSLIEKVNQERKESIVKSNESAYVYLQFYFRSNPDKTFKLLEQLHCIGSQPATERSWFLCKQKIDDDPNASGEYNKYKLIFVNTFEAKSNPRKARLVEIAESMAITQGDMEQLLGELLTSLKHQHVLTFDTVEVNFDKERILFVQDYSRDGSLRDFIRKSKPDERWEIKNRQLMVGEKYSPLPIKSVREYTKQIIAGLIYLNRRLVFALDNLHSGNVILAYKKRVCLLTGYESLILLGKTRVDKLNERQWPKIVKSYLLRVRESEDLVVLRKAKNDMELKQIIQVLRLGVLVIEMCTGIESDDLIPGDQQFNEINATYKPTDAKELIGFLNFLYFNRQMIDEENPKLKGRKYIYKEKK